MVNIEQYVQFNIRAHNLQIGDGVGDLMKTKAILMGRVFEAVHMINHPIKDGVRLAVSLPRMTQFDEEAGLENDVGDVAKIYGPEDLLEALMAREEIQASAAIGALKVRGPKATRREPALALIRDRRAEKYTPSLCRKERDRILRQADRGEISNPEVALRRLDKKAKDRSNLSLPHVPIKSKTNKRTYYLHLRSVSIESTTEQAAALNSYGLSSISSPVALPAT